jgi:hypothetical protein
MFFFIKIKYTGGMKIYFFLRLYKPLLILVFLALFAASFILIRNGYSLNDFFHYWMAELLLFFSFFKLVDISRFRDGFLKYDLLAKKISIYAYIYPFLELFLSLLYFSFLFKKFTYFLTFIIFLENFVSVVFALKNKLNLQCACLGTIFNVPLTYVTLIEDLFMLLMSGYMWFGLILGKL